MDAALYQNHLEILREELIVAMGCTDPISIAYAAAKAREALGEEPESCRVLCSGNIIKNAKSVIVPNSGGLFGMEVAAALGAIGGNAGLGLAVLESATAEDAARVKKLVPSGFCKCELAEGVPKLYVKATVYRGDSSASVELQNQYDNITLIEKNGVALYEKAASGNASVNAGAKCDRMKLSLENMLEFALEAAEEDLEPILAPQIECNSAISAEGLAGEYGACVGKTLLSNAGDSASIRLRARAAAAAGSDARMGGCALPVVINSGSGNQGLTVSLPLLTYAKKCHAERGLLLRSLALANLISVHQKKYIGSVSAYCGATSAAAGSACGIAFMTLSEDFSNEELLLVISNTLETALCTLGGMVCDGAKPSCAAKISIAVENALIALDLSLAGRGFAPGQGLMQNNAEETIAAIGRMAREGMRSTDTEIINIMLNN